MRKREIILAVLCLAVSMLLSGCGDGTTDSSPVAPSESATNSADIEPSETGSAPISEAPSESPSEEPSEPISGQPSDSPAEEPSAATSEEPSPPTSGEPGESEGTAHYVVHGYGPNDEPFDTITKDFTLQNIIQESSSGDDILDLVITYTRSPELKTFSNEVLTVLPKGGRIIVDGLRTGDAPVDYVAISAWSDPDNDGIFTQHIFVTSGDAPTTTSLDEGPFEFRYDGTSEHGYTTSDMLYMLDGTTGDPPSTVEVSAELLTKFFGPNTIFQLEIGTTGYFEWGFGSQAQAYYSYYIPND